MLSASSPAVSGNLASRQRAYRGAFGGGRGGASRSVRGDLDLMVELDSMAYSFGELFEVDSQVGFLDVPNEMPGRIEPTLEWLKCID